MESIFRFSAGGFHFVLSAGGFHLVSFATSVSLRFSCDGNLPMESIFCSQSSLAYLISLRPPSFVAFSSVLFISTSAIFAPLFVIISRREPTSAHLSLMDRVSSVADLSSYISPFKRCYLRISCSVTFAAKAKLLLQPRRKSSTDENCYC